MELPEVDKQMRDWASRGLIDSRKKIKKEDLIKAKSKKGRGQSFRRAMEGLLAKIFIFLIFGTILFSCDEEPTSFKDWYLISTMRLAYRIQNADDAIGSVADVIGDLNY